MYFHSLVCLQRSQGARLIQSVDYGRLYAHSPSMNCKAEVEAMRHCWPWFYTVGKSQGNPNIHALHIRGMCRHTPDNNRARSKTLVLPKLLINLTPITVTSTLLVASSFLQHRFPHLPDLFSSLPPHFPIPMVRTASAATVGEPDATELRGAALWHVGVGIGVFASNRLAREMTP